MRVAIYCSLLVAMVGMFGCSTDSNTRTSSAKADPPEGAPSGVEPGRYVVVPSSATFSSGTGAGAERWSYEGGNLWTFEVVSVESNWIRVRPPDPSELGRVCHGVPRALHPVELEFFVEREQLRTVTTDRVEADYEDGTGLSLRPGVVVRTDGEPSRAALHGLEIPISPPDDRLGPTYRPGEPVSPSPDAGWWKFPDGVVVGGEHVESGGQSLPVRDTHPREDGVLAEMADGCGTLRMVGDSAVEGDAPKSSRPGPSESFQVTWVRPNSPVYWLDGSEAGRTGDSKWPLRVRAKSRNDRPCFVAGFQTVAPKSFESQRHFRVCFDDSSLETPREAAEKRAAAAGDQGEAGNVSVLETEAQIRLVGLTGGHSWDQIKQPIASRKNALEQCYKQRVAPENTFAGEVRLTVSIASDGSVSQVVSESSTLGDERVTSCLQGTLRDLSFPRAGERSELDIELVFSVRDR